MKYYTAGGAVRDRLLGLPVHDTDFVFEGTEEEFIQRNPNARKVRDLPTPIYILNGLEYTPLSCDGLADDMLRRDFTINALLLSEDGFLHAHPDTFQDLMDKVLRPVSPQALLNDPIRAYRAARFAAALPGFSLHTDTFSLMQALGPEVLSDIAAEQVGREVQKACAGDTPGNFLRILTEGRCLLPWFEEFAEAASIVAGPPAYHHGRSVLEHTANVMDATAQATREWEKKNTSSENREECRQLAVWMALCHDIGKNFTPQDILPKHIGHEERGEGKAEELGKRLRLPAKFIKAGKIAAKLHMKAGRYALSRPGTKVDLLMSLHAAHVFTPFFLMASQDSGIPHLLEDAERDLQTILNVRLPQDFTGQGAEYGERLRLMRCEALSNM